MSSTGPLNLNWLSNVIKPRTRSTEGDAETPGTPSQGSLASDKAALAPSQERYMAWTDREPFNPVPDEPEAPAAPKSEAPPSNALELDWVTGSPSAGSSGPNSASRATSAGLDVEWQTGNASSQPLGGSSGTTPTPSSGGLNVEWRSGNSPSGLGGLQAGGGQTSSSAGLGVEWRSGNTPSGQGGLQVGGGRASSPSGLGVEWRGGNSGLGASNGSGTSGIGASSGGGGRSGGLDVGWSGNAGGSGAISPPPPETGSEIQPKPSPEPETKAETKPPAESESKPTDAAPLNSAQLAEIRQALVGPLPALPERPTSDNWQQNDLRNRAALIVGIRGDAALQAAFADWERLPNDLRLEAGKRISALEGAAYGFEPAALKLDSGLRKPDYGYYHPTEDAVHLSADTLSDLKEFVNTVTHEQAHAYQWEKAEDAKKGRMPSSDPLYATAMSWHANYFNYVQPHQGYQAYRSQPIEAHAFAVGDAVSAGVFS
ncbi:hypothetical protein D3C86_365320 [compost metagenome]